MLPTRPRSRSMRGACRMASRACSARAARRTARRDAAAAAVRRRFAVIAGGPGTGKTTTVARIVALLCEQAGRRRAAAASRARRADRQGRGAAGGGRPRRGARAGRRRGRAPDAAGPAGLDAPPAARLAAGSRSRFRHDRDQRLPHDVVIVDETSMVSLSLMARLIEALRSDARLVLVGDPGQLASIEAGAVLGDIVDADRAGAHPSGPRRDRRARPRPPLRRRRSHRWRRRSAHGDGDAVMELLRGGLRRRALDRGRRRAPGGAGAAARRGAARPSEAVVDAARRGRRRRGAARARRRSASSARTGAGPTAWRAGRRGWRAGCRTPWPEFSASRALVRRPAAAGHRERLRARPRQRRHRRRRRGPARAACWPPSSAAASSSLLSPSRLGAVDTVYAMTIHKSQGSQFDTAAVLLPEPDSRILTRELLYTAVTRASASSCSSAPRRRSAPPSSAESRGRRGWPPGCGAERSIQVDGVARGCPEIDGPATAGASARAELPGEVRS